MAFDLGQVVIRVDSVKQGLAETQAGLAKTEQAAEDTAEAVGKLGQAAGKAAQDVAYGMKTAAGTVGATGETFTDFFDKLDRDQKRVLEQIKGPWARYQADLTATNALFREGQISMGEFEGASARLADRMGALQRRDLSPQLRLEVDLLEQITGPLKRYEQELAALQSLLSADQISLQQFDAALEKVQRRAQASGAIAPVQGPAYNPAQAGQSAAAPESNLTGGLQSAVGTAGALLAGGGIAAGILGLGHSIESLVTQYHDLQDVTIEVTNSAMKFADATHSANLIIDEQIRLANQLHSSERATIELYDTVRDGTDDLNISHADQIRLTKTLGEAVQLAGRSMESASGVVQRLSYAMARGKIEVLDLNRIMRQVPELGDLWTKSFDTDRQGLIAMVREGKIGVEDIVRSLVSEGKFLDDNFAKRARTNKQKEEEWLLNEKIYSQRYDVALGQGHGAQALVDTLKANPEQMNAYMSIPGQMGDLAKEANRQYIEEQKAAVTELITDLTKLQGPFQKIGDAWRKMTGDTAAVRAEVTKLNEPVEQARSEMTALNKAFEIGKVDVETYTKRYNELLTTINHGFGSEAYKITEPIRQAQKELATLQDEIAFGFQVPAEQLRKAVAQYQATIKGFTPEDLKLNNPKLEAQDQLADLSRAWKEGKITAESFRREYDQLITTLNDGRLPEAIKIMEGIHLPIEQAVRDFSALSALWKSGRLDVEQYAAELKKISDTKLNGYASILADDIAVLNKRWDDGQLGVRSYDEAVRKLTKSFEEMHRTSSGIAYRIAPNLAAGGGSQSVGEAARSALGQPSLDFSGAVPATSDYAGLRTQELERANEVISEFISPATKYEQKLGDINRALALNGITEEQANAARRRAHSEYNSQIEALEATKGPLEAYNAAIKKLGDQLAAGDISAKQYGDGIDKARVAMLQATGAAEGLQGALEIEWIKMKGEADQFGASLAKMAVDDLGKFNDALVAIANGGQVSFSQLADSIIQDLERIGLKMLEIRLITGIGGFFTGGGGSAAGLSGLPQNIDQLATQDGLWGFASGGSYVVGGSGGVDSQLQMFRATPGERVTITPPGAYPYVPASSPSAGSVASRGQAPIVQVHNHYDSDVVTAGIQSGSGQTAVLNMLRANRSAIRAVLGIS